MRNNLSVEEKAMLILWSVFLKYGLPVFLILAASGYFDR